MTSRASRSALLALGIGVALAAGPAPVASGAQTPPQQLPANPQRAAPDPAQPGDPRAFERRANRFEERLDRRLEFLRSELQITPPQEPLWAAFADAVRRESETGRDQFLDRRDEFIGPPDGRFERPGIVERLERRQQSLEQRSAYYDRLLSALRPLYAALNEDQRRAADEHLFSPDREDFGGRGFRRFGMDRDFDRGFGSRFDRPFGPLERPFGPLDRYNRFDRYERYGR